MSVIQGTSVTGAGDVAAYEIERSLRFNSADSAYLNRTPASAGDRKTWTWSAWVKRGIIANGALFQSPGAGGFGVEGYIDIVPDLRFQFDYNGGSNLRLVTSQLFRDVSAWYHIVAVADTTNATSTDRLRLYVNGSRVTAFSSSNYPSQNADGTFNQAYVHALGARATPTDYFDGYITEVHFIDGQALTPSSFGKFNPITGVWQPIEYTGTYGTTGFYLNFSDNASTTTLGDDFSGNGNDWTTNNFSVTAGAGNDSLVDSPTRYGTDTGAGGEVRGNYCTPNVLDKHPSITMSQANLKVQLYVLANGSAGYRGTTGVSSGKWYWEVLVGANQPSRALTTIGIDAINTPITAVNTAGSGAVATSYIYFQFNGNKVNNSVSTAYGATYTTNDVIGVAFNADAGTLTFYKNGVSQGQAFSGLSGTFAPSGSFYTDTVNGTYTADVQYNFGQRPFAYTAPSGFNALVTTNLPTPAIEDGGDYFNAILYTGTGSTNAQTGVGFQPDLVWIKERNASADHALYDAVRGVQQQLESNTTTDETTESTGLTAFGSDGFTVGSLAQVNTNNDTYVAWCWKEGATPGFDIVTYTGNGTARTISHNLGAVPNMIIVKARTTASTDQGWPVYHSANTAAPATDYLLLNTTAATADLDTVWNDTAPTSSVFSVGTNALVNANNDTYVAYLFANVAGYSAFGSYTGNGSADGPFVFVNHRPAFLLIKRTDTTSNWTILDFTRIGYNVDNNPLFPNLSDAEGTTDLADLISNGFKLRSTDASVNANTGVYIYAAFAENPFSIALAR